MHVSILYDVLSGMCAVHSKQTFLAKLKRWCTEHLSKSCSPEEEGAKRSEINKLTPEAPFVALRLTVAKTRHKMFTGHLI